MHILSKNKETEQTIVGKLKTGNVSSFQIVYDEYSRSLHYFAQKIVQNKQVSEDIVQDTFIKLWERRECFDNMASIKSFLYMTTKNSCIDTYRHNQIIKDFIQNNQSNESMIHDDSTDLDLIESDIIRTVHKAVDNLPSRCRSVMLLSLKGHSNQDVADQLNVTINTVKTQKQRALKLLKEQLGSDLLIYLLLFSEKFL